MSRPVVILGATGSIGRQALEVAESLGLSISGLAARMPSEELADLASKVPDATVVVVGGSAEERDDFEGRVGGRRVRFGSGAMLELAATPGTAVVNGVVGAAGLRASVAALEAGNRLALANKETLVAGGDVVVAARDRGGGELIPVDSEHSALFQLLGATPPGQVSRLVLTASGGPFRGRTTGELADVTPEEALRHPTWQMGSRITIDSASLANKGLEVIEAHVLFSVPFERIDVVIHPQSVVHSLVALVDGSLVAHLGPTDMRIPIRYALTHPERTHAAGIDFDLVDQELSFERPDPGTFPMLRLAYEAGRSAGSSPAVYNAADEIAVEAFLMGRLGFLGIPEVVERTLDSVEWSRPTTVDEVLEVDSLARSVAASILGGTC